MSSKDEGFSGGTVDSTVDPTLVEPNDPLVGTQIGGRYTILARIAKGGTAVVYRALDTVLNREVAIKVLHEHLENKQEVVGRFKKEAVTIAKLRHPNILTVYDFLEHQGRAVLVVEFMPGESLAALIKSVDRIPEDVVLMLTHEILLGLKAAHEQGIAHRDIKPANVLVHSEFGVKISDFGLAKFVDSDDQMTREGMFVGTPSFSSPEQIEGRPVDHRTDLFSLGLTMYILATRSHAFKKKGDSTTTVWYKTVRGTFEAPQIRNPELSEEFSKIVAKALEVKVERRYPSAQEMLTDIENLLKTRKLFPYQEALKGFLKNPHLSGNFLARGLSGRQKKHRLTWALALLGFSIALGSVGYFLWMKAPPPESQVVEEQVIETPVAQETPFMATSPVIESPSPLAASPKIEEPSVETKPPLESPAVKRRWRRVPPPSSAAVSPPKASPVVQVPRFLSAIEIRPRSRIVLMPGENLPGFRLTWSGAHELLLAADAQFTKLLLKADSPENVWDLKNLPARSFYWKAGQDSGQIESLSLAEYRMQAPTVKKPLIVNSQFGDVDLVINPFSEELRLSWQAGPEASTYRVEVGEDSAFQKLLFSGEVRTKTMSFERFWNKSMSFYWRVSYLDESKNVFLIDPIRKINLKVRGPAPFSDLISPRPGEILSDPNVEIKAVGTGQSDWSCVGVVSDQVPSAFVSLKPSGLFLTARISVPKNAEWIVCKTIEDRKALYFVIPVKSQFN